MKWSSKQFTRQIDSWSAYVLCHHTSHRVIPSTEWLCPRPCLVIQSTNQTRLLLRRPSCRLHQEKFSLSSVKTTAQSDRSRRSFSGSSRSSTVIYGSWRRIAARCIDGWGDQRVSQAPKQCSKYFIIGDKDVFILKRSSSSKEKGQISNYPIKQLIK